jgi:hypothetical protein
MADLSEAVLVDTSAFLELEGEGGRFEQNMNIQILNAAAKAFKAVMVYYCTWKR